MVQISKLTKAELAITGFKNRSITSCFMKQINKIIKKNTIKIHI